LPEWTTYLFFFMGVGAFYAFVERKEKK